MKNVVTIGLGMAALVLTITLAAQTTVSEIAFEANADLLKMPANTFLGEVAGVAANSRGNILVYTRTGDPWASLGDSRTFYRAGSRLFEFSSNGAFVRELGQDLYGFNAAQGLRIDPQDNIWTIDAGANQVVKFDTAGRVVLVLGRKPETMSVRPAAPRGGAAAPPAATPPAAAVLPAAPQAAARGAIGGRGTGAGAQGSSFNRPTDVAWDRAGNIYIADGIGTNNRIAKFDKDGKFLKSWGQTGAENGQFSGVRSIAIDAQGNVYVADAGNKRIQVFDSEGAFKSQITGIGTPQALCMTRGATQYLYSAHSGDPDGMVDAAIYKVGLDGKVIGKFGSAGRMAKEFSLVNSLDCRNENELLVGEMASWRVQKITLRAMK
ncbi:MAG TPA: peptidyl-alpha-hydroxyglycine alpha-amidating lyase family protein [Terriglobia bacterium]|nr:peptidyl-alpha-hydroxyglycine alpha-amidating lyase family protein [Terriglobia bacterium]